MLDKTVSFRLSDDDYSRLKDVVSKTGNSQTELIRVAIIREMDRREANK